MSSVDQQMTITFFLISRLATFLIRDIIFICEDTAVDRFAVDLRVQVLYLCCVTLGDCAIDRFPIPWK